MSGIFYNENKCVPFYTEWRPLNVMKDGKKIAGWKEVSNIVSTDTNVNVPIEDTYNDKLQYVVHGRSVQPTEPSYVLWNQSFYNVMPTTQRTDNLIVVDGAGGSSVFWDGDDDYASGIWMYRGNGNNSVSFKYDKGLIEGHEYMVYVDTADTITFNTPFYIESWHYSIPYRVIYGTQIGIFTAKSGDPNKITTSIPPTSADWNIRILNQNSRLSAFCLHRVMLIDLTLMFDGKQGTFNKSYPELKEMVDDVINRTSQPISTVEDTKVPVEYEAYGGGGISPDHPVALEPVQIVVYTNKSVATWDNLHFADEVHEDGRISRYTKTKHIYDCEWRESHIQSPVIECFRTTLSDHLSGDFYMGMYERVESLTDLADKDYGFYINNSTHTLYVKDKDIPTNPDEFIRQRGYSSFWYRGNIGTAYKMEGQELLTSPYRTVLGTNTDITYTYKKFDL